MAEVKSAAEIEALLRRCVAGYPGAQAMKIAIIHLPGQEPNWDCIVEYSNSARPDDSSEREVAALKHRFRLPE